MSAQRIPQLATLELPAYVVLDNGRLRHATFSKLEATQYLRSLRRARETFSGLQMLTTTAVVRMR